MLLILRYPVCKCPALYTGPHCEFLKSDDPNPTSPEVDNNTKADSHMRKAGLIVVLVFVLGILILIGLFTRRKIRRTRKRKQQEVTSTNLQGFRDGGTDSNINFAVSSNRSRPSKLISAIVDPRRHMRRKNSFNSTDSLNRVTRQPISDQEKYRTGSFYRRGNQRSAVFEASNQLVLQSSDAPKKGKLFDVQFV